MLGLAAAGLLTGQQASAQTVDTVRIANGLSRPVFATAPKADYNRLFVVEQFSGSVGRVRIINIPANTLNPTPFLSVTPVATGNEQGLLGLAFHPNFLDNGYFFVNYTNGSGTTIIARYQANAPFATSTTANAASATTVLTITQPFSNHNGGWIGFAPNDTEGLLFVGTGDGGSANDPGNRAQNINDLLGKMLRIDVDGADNIPGNDDDDGIIGMTQPPYTSPSDNPFAGPTAGRDEIWATGLRNPWRNSFDRLDSRLFIGDVGQNAIEEVSVAALNASGVNYGWRCMEGNNCTGLTGCTCNAAALRRPVLQYSHAGGACSITGGYVYRGCAVPAIYGQYFYADYCSAQIFSNAYAGDGTVAAGASTTRTAELAPGGGLSIGSITSFGEDAYGELYICDQAGEIFKVVSSVLVDCNANLVSDACDIDVDHTLDTNSNGVIDSCERAACCVGTECTTTTQAACLTAGGVFQGLGTSCTEPNRCPAPPTCPCDWNDDSTLTSQDFFDFIAAFFSDNGDFNEDGMTTSQDFFDFLACFFEPPMGC